MKSHQHTLLTITFAACTLAAVGNLSAQGKLNDLTIVTVTLKAQLQRTGYNSKDGTTRNFANPLTQTLNTQNLLDRLALDKKAQGFYSATTFPGGSKLALEGDHLVVVKNNNDFIVDVSDIISFVPCTNAVSVISGSTNNTTGLASQTLTELTIVRLNFDDTFIVGGSDLSFYAQGLDTVKTIDSTPNPSNGKYNENITDKIEGAAGDGQSGGSPFVITGSIQGKRNVSLTLSPPVPAI